MGKTGFDFSAILQVFITFLPFLLLVSISSVLYVFHSLGLMKIAKNRGIANPWLAWIPYVNTYLLGKVSDDISLHEGKCTKHRKVLLVTDILGAIGICSFYFTWSLTVGFAILMHDSPESSAEIGATMMFILSIILLLMGVASAVIHAVFYCIALYRIFKTYSPSYAVLFLVLSIFQSLLASIFLFVIRNKVPVEPIMPSQPTEVLSESEEQ